MIVVSDTSPVLNLARIGRLELTVTGLLRVVAKAKRAGLIDLARPVVDELIQSARFWIGPDLYAEVLAELGELE